jgi:hypothetical protein
MTVAETRDQPEAGTDDPTVKATTPAGPAGPTGRIVTLTMVGGFLTAALLVTVPFAGAEVPGRRQRVGVRRVRAPPRSGSARSRHRRQRASALAGHGRHEVSGVEATPPTWPRSRDRPRTWRWDSSSERPCEPVRCAVAQPSARGPATSPSPMRKSLRAIHMVSQRPKQRRNSRDQFT